MSWLDGISEEEWINHDDGHAGGLPHKHEAEVVEFFGGPENVPDADEGRGNPYRPDSFVRLYNDRPEEFLDYKPIVRRTTDYRGITDEMLRMLEYKEADYGGPSDPLANIKSSEKYGIRPWVAALVRAGDKMARLEAAARGQQLLNETPEDSMLDAANYLVIALKLFREEVLETSKQLDVTFRPDFGDQPV